MKTLLSRSFVPSVLWLLICSVIASDCAASAAVAVHGRVVDEATQHAIQGAWVTSGAAMARTDHDGRFELRAGNQTLAVRSVGFRRKEAPVCPEITIALRPLRVRGLYLSFWGVGSATLRNGVLDTIDKAHLNAIVIDVKGDRSLVSFPTHSAVAMEAGANHIITIRDPAALIADLHRRGLYAIARIVVFKDNTVARSKPEWAVKMADGTLFIDREGLAWTDPFHRAVWDYNIGLAVEAAKLGFDEIQFDYVRFPDRKGLQFAKVSTEANRREAILGFLSEAMKQLAPYNTFLSADNFGYVCWNLDDTGIGQCIGDTGSVVDYISPMLYPSSFQYGIPGVRNPLDDPYKIVYASLERAKQRTALPSVTFRPWLQAFNDYAFDRRKFGKFELRAQIKAAEDAHSDGWLLWDPKNRYPSDLLSELGRELWWDKER